MVSKVSQVLCFKFRPKLERKYVKTSECEIQTKKRKGNIVRHCNQVHCGPWQRTTPRPLWALCCEILSNDAMKKFQTCPPLTNGSSVYPQNISLNFSDSRILRLSTDLDIKVYTDLKHAKIKWKFEKSIGKILNFKMKILCQ